MIDHHRQLVAVVLVVAGWLGQSILAAQAVGPEASLPELNQKVLNFAVEHIGQQVGNGECWALAAEALEAAGAEPPQGLVFGRELKVSEPWLPGDIYCGPAISGQRSLLLR